MSPWHVRESPAWAAPIRAASSSWQQVWYGRGQGDGVKGCGDGGTEMRLLVLLVTRAWWPEDVVKQEEGVCG